MIKRKRLIISVLLIVSLFGLIGCDVDRKVKNEEIKKFTESILESNDKILELNFYFRRPTLRGKMVYEGDLDKEDFQFLVNEFKTLIDVEFMQKIGDEYRRGARPSGFNLNIYVDEKKEENNYDYQISSQYNKTHIHDEEPDNIDGYETWTIYDKKGSEVIMDL